jgi:hypothetical protein
LLVLRALQKLPGGNQKARGTGGASRDARLHIRIAAIANWLLTGFALKARQ